ncbi:hypothetical protein I552_0650 [Mycobacterium xenopi 3993]|nr:hypothetical protein I552_0650 [Mycobacterium xenopi 3993]
MVWFGPAGCVFGIKGLDVRVVRAGGGAQVRGSGAHLLGSALETLGCCVNQLGGFVHALLARVE